jgi:hypothetical protein
MSKYCFIDFEFQLHCKNPKLVCVVLKWKDGVDDCTFPYWLWHNEEDREQLLCRLIILNRSGFTFVSFTDAEARCFYALGLDPLQFKWIDAQILGYPFFHSSKEFGQYAQDNFWIDEEDFWWNDESVETDSEQIEKTADKNLRRKAASLLGFYEFFCKESVEAFTGQKDLVRHLIINAKSEDEFDAQTQQQILDYCASDVELLRKLFIAQVQKWQEVANISEEEVVKRFRSFTDFRIRMASVSWHGLPINKAVYEQLTQTYQTRIEEEQGKLPDFYRYEPPQPYKIKAKRGQIRVPGHYIQDYTKFVLFLRRHQLDHDWPRTPTGKFSTDEKVLSQFQVVPEIEDFWLGRKRMKHIEFFKPDENGVPKIAQFVTEENGMLWQHPEFGTFGTNTSRNAHKTKTFIMGMERNLRKTLLGCPEGMVVLQPDFSAQEVWIAGALSGDKNQLRAAFEDPYLFFGRVAGIVPENGDKYTHERERDICKTVVLAAFYGMGFQSLKNKLQLPTAQVRDLQQKNRELYATYFQWRDKFLADHQRTRYYELPDGWPLLHNQKPNGEYKVCPAMNFPIQGTAAVIMRKVVDLFFERGKFPAFKEVRLIYTLHDEFGVLCPIQYKHETQEFMKKIMQSACRHYFPALEPPRVGFK